MTENQGSFSVIQNTPYGTLSPLYRLPVSFKLGVEYGTHTPTHTHLCLFPTTGISCFPSVCFVNATTWMKVSFNCCGNFVLPTGCLSVCLYVCVGVCIMAGWRQSQSSFRSLHFISVSLWLCQKSGHITHICTHTHMRTEQHLGGFNILKQYLWMFKALWYDLSVCHF